MESRLAVLIVADLADYSRMMEEDEARALGAIGELKETHFEPVVEGHGGEILKRMGDGWIVAFSSVAAAVRAAMEVQTGLAGHRVIRLRIGAHLGEIVFDDTDFHGAGVNLAERLQTEAPPGGLMIGQDLYRQLGGELAEAFTDAGSFKLKNIALPVQGYQWRPERRGTAAAGEVPLIAVEPFPAAPDETDTRAAADDLRDQLILRLSRRTGVRVADESAGRSESPDYRLRGRLRVTQGRGRFNLALITEGGGRPLSSQTYEGDTTDIFRFCDDVIERADADLRLRINAFDAERIAHLLGDELNEAISSFEKSVALSESDPLLPYRLFLEAVALVCAGRPGEAAETVDWAIELRPNEWPFHRLLALCHRRAGDEEAAAKVEAWAGRLTPAPSVLAPRPPVPDAHAALAEELRPG